MNRNDQDYWASQNKVIVDEHGAKYVPAEAILKGVDDRSNTYWNSFLPIFFERMTYLMRRSMENSMKGYGLNNTHAYCLISLNLRGAMTMGQLSEFLDLDVSNINRSVKVLIEKNLVYDDRKTPTSKKFKLYLTDEGKKLSDILMSQVQERIDGYFDGIDNEDVVYIRHILVKILRNVDPGFREYVESEYTNPFYTYLGTNPYFGDVSKETYIAKRKGSDTSQDE